MAVNSLLLWEKFDLEILGSVFPCIRSSWRWRDPQLTLPWRSTFFWVKRLLEEKGWETDSCSSGGAAVTERRVSGRTPLSPGIWVAWGWPRLLSPGQPPAVSEKEIGMSSVLGNGGLFIPRWKVLLSVRSSFVLNACLNDCAPPYRYFSQFPPLVSSAFLLTWCWGPGRMCWGHCRVCHLCVSAQASRVSVFLLSCLWRQVDVTKEWCSEIERRVHCFPYWKNS